MNICDDDRKSMLTRLCLVLIAFLLGAPSAALASSYSYFNMDETYSSNSAAFTKWNTMLARFSQQQKLPEEKCGQVQYFPCRVKEWTHFLNTQRDKAFDDKIVAVNDYINAFPYVTDKANWNGDDFWETPYEFFTVSGNCKDYAIAKYFSLRALGVPASAMRIIVLQDLNLGGVIHAVLGVYHHGKLEILDNQIKQVAYADDIYHYRPIYGINEAGWWRYGPRSGAHFVHTEEAEVITHDNSVASGAPDENSSNDDRGEGSSVKSSSLRHPG